MRQANEKQREQWLQVSAHVLQEKRDQLQPRILEIYRNSPGLSSYATDLAQLRMTGKNMEGVLLQIWNAQTPDSIDLIISTNTLHHPANRALTFFAELVKSTLIQEATIVQ